MAPPTCWGCRQGSLGSECPQQATSESPPLRLLCCPSPPMKKLRLRGQPRPQPHWPALSQGGEYRVGFQGWQGLRTGCGIGVCGRDTTALGYLAGRAASREPCGRVPGNSDCLPALATKPNSDRLCLGAPSSWALWPPPGCACPGLPANSCLPTRSMGGPLWTSGYGDRKSPPPPDPQATVRDTNPRAGLVLSVQAVCSMSHN